jgi:DNA primase
MDAIAVTLATHGAYVGVAALGTALTREQARQLRRYTDLPIVATDNDEAGRAAAQRDYWILTDVGHDPLCAILAEGTDPADLVTQDRSRDLDAALRASAPLSHTLLAKVIADRARDGSIEDAVRVIGAASPTGWSNALSELAKATGRSVPELHAALATHLGLRKGIRLSGRGPTTSRPHDRIPDPAFANGTAAPEPSDSIRP